ncbi:MAG: adenylate/guanylate cyclase domain-containing protein [Dehalococcoidia bacterium]
MERSPAARGNRSPARFAPYVPRILASWDDPGGAVHMAVPGTLVFVDISGFTALSERLAVNGKVGAEQVSFILSECFSQLLEKATEYGGDLLKFGGDALLLLFTDEGHEARAAAAAARMRATLRIAGSAAVTGGEPLRMSVGVHSGLVDLFLVGTEHRELVITGLAATATAAMEKAAEANDILVSPATAAHLPENVLGPGKGGGVLLARTPPAAAIVELPLPRPAEHLVNFVPVALRRYLATPAAEGEHRRVVIGFIQFQGVDSLLAAGATAHIAERLHALVSAVQAAAAEMDICMLSTDIDSDGGKIILTAGAPKGTRDDEERLLLTVRKLLDDGTALPVRVGVNRGHVFAGDVGAKFRRTYTVMGDDVNLAARLMARARIGDILATRGVPERSRVMFEAEAEPAFMAKGKALPVESVRIGGALGARRVAQAYNLPLIGRAAEMGVLKEGLESAKKGSGRAVEIRGEPGVGKTKLVEEMLAQLQEYRSFRFISDQYSQRTPYLAFREVVRAVARITSGGQPGGRSLERAVQRGAPHLAPWLPLLAVVADVEVPATPETDALDPRFRRERLQQTVTGFLEALLTEPAVIVFEDLYFLDESSLELLRHLVARVDDRPWLLLLLNHADSTPLVQPDGANRFHLPLEPLSPEATQLLALNAVESTPVAPEQLAIAQERAGGNPLFLLELLAAGATTSTGELPDNVEAVIASRIDQLDPFDRRFLRSASVLGSVFSEDLLQRCRSVDQAWDADEEVWHRLSDFIEHSERNIIRFRHRLFRDSAYEGLAFRARRGLHERVGGILEGEPDAEQQVDALALHFSRAGLDGKAWRYSVQAADRARDRYATAEAVNFYTQALHHGRGLAPGERDEVARVYEAQGDVLELLARFSEAEASFALAGKRSDPGGPAVARLVRKRGMLREHSGGYSQALRWLGRSLAMLERLPQDPQRDEERAETLIGLAGVKFRQGKYAEAAGWCRAAIELVNDGEHPGLLAHAYFVLDHSLSFLGEGEAGRYAALALPIYRDLNDLVGQSSVLNNLGVDAYYRGQLDEAVDYWRQGMEASERAGDYIGAARQRNNIAEVLSDQGHVAEAEVLFNDALEAFQRANYALGVAFAQSNLGRAATRSGRPAEAAVLLTQALDSFEALGTQQLIAETRLRIVENLDALTSSEHEQALALVNELLGESASAMEIASQASLRRLRGRALAGLGRLAEAERELRAALAQATAAGNDAEAARIRATLEQ